MPLISLATLANLRDAGYAAVRSRFSGKAVSDGTFLGKWANIIAMELFGLQRTAEAIDRDSPPNSKSSAAGINAWAYAVGVPSNAGGWGPNVATPATGGQAPVTGTVGTVVLAGQQLTAPDGSTILTLQATGTIPFTGSFAAVTPGTVGNLPTGTKLTWISPPAGCDGFVFLSSPLTDGLDAEQPADLLARELAKFQQPPKGGANIDYITWALAQAGVEFAWVYPCRQGVGTVDLVIGAGGSGLGRIPPEPVRLVVENFVTAIQPTFVEELNVQVPVMRTGAGLSIRVRAVLNKYSWDWDDTAHFYLVSAYSAGTPSITLNALTPAPPSLIAAVAAGVKPRIQVVSGNTGAPVIPEQLRVTAIDVTGLILTLDAPMVNAAITGDFVFAGSYPAPLVAQAVLDYVDTLGPARASLNGRSYADIVNPWDDTASVFNMAARATDALDVDGKTKLLNKVRADSITIDGQPLEGVNISIGAFNNAPTFVDYQPRDYGYATLGGPDMVRALNVYVTQ